MPAIIDLLERKHSGDVFVRECKDGPSQTRSHLRMDAWVMPRSWSKPACIGYEIKTSRQDFLRDEKWQGYLKLCNLLYFVCPAKVIQPAELSHGVGLMWLSSTGTKLYTKQKAAHRDVEIPESLFRYVLMRATRFQVDRREDPNEFWRRWLIERAKNRELGYEVRGEIRHIFNEMKAENIRLRSDALRVKKVTELLAARGLDIGAMREWRLEDQIDEALGLAAPELLSKTRAARNALGGFEEELERRLDKPRR